MRRRPARVVCWKPSWLEEVLWEEQDGHQCIPSKHIVGSLWEGVAKESWGYTRGAYLGGLSETVAHILCEQGRHLIAQLQARALCHEPD